MIKRIINTLILNLLPILLVAQLGTTSWDDTLLATFVYDQGQYNFHIHDLKTGHLIRKINAGFSKLDKVIFTHDKHYLLALSTKTLFVYNVSSGQLVRKFYQTAAFDLAKNNVLAVISNSYPYTINLTDGKQVRYSISVGKVASDIHISGNGQHLAVVTRDRMVYIYNFGISAPVDVVHGDQVIVRDNSLAVVRREKNDLHITSYAFSGSALVEKHVFHAATALKAQGLPVSWLVPSFSLPSQDGSRVVLYLGGGDVRHLLIFDTQSDRLVSRLDNNRWQMASFKPVAWTTDGRLIIWGKGLDGLEYDPMTGIVTPLHWEMYNPSHNPALLPKEQRFRRRFSPDYHYVIMPLYEGRRRFLLVRDALVDKRQISYADAEFITFSHDSRQMYVLIQGIVFRLNTALIRQAMQSATVARLTQLGTAVYGEITEKLKTRDDPPPAGYKYPFTQKLVKVTDIDTQKLYVLLRGLNLDPKNVEVKLNLVDQQGHLITGATDPQWLYLWCNLLLQNRSLKVEQENFVVKEVHETQPAAYALVLDHSGSMGDERANALQFGAWQLIHKKKPQDAFLLIKYDNRPRLEVRLTKNASSFFIPLNNQGLKGFGGGTALNDALYLTIAELAKAQGYKRRVVYLFTDGYENASQYTKVQVLRAALRNKVEIFTIGFGRDVNEQYLQDIAYLTGGSFYHIYRTSELRRIFTDVDLKRRYYYRVRFVTDYPGKYIALLQLCQDFKHHDSLVLGFTNDPAVPPEKKHIRVNPRLSPEQRQAFQKKTIPCRPPDQPVKDPKVMAEFNQIHFPDILFAFDSDRILRSEERGLNEIAQFMKRHPQVYLMIEGYTDSIGSYEYNLDLSRRRAEAAKRLLVAKGIAPGRIFTRGYGESRPIASNATDEGRARNRRIEFHIFRY